MNLATGKLVKGTVWTVGAFGASQLLRLGTNVILTRLLAPELFGLMLVVNTLMTGVQLISDVGIGQNIVYSKNAEKPAFYNTAWTIQIIRSIGVWLAFMAASVPAARFYEMPVLATILPIAGISILVGGLQAVSPSILQKRLEFAKLNVFQLVTGVFSAAAFVLLGYLTRTIWSLVAGGIVASVVSTAASFFLLPELKHKFCLDRRVAWEIVNYGKWIFVSSIVYFLSGNFDRLYFAKVVPLQLLGVYGIARSISELLAIVAARLGNTVVFPFIASHADMPRDSLRLHLIPIRSQFLWLTALGCSLFVATADLAIKIIFDQRYHAAGWMLPILIVGAWFSTVAMINESTLLGLGRPFYLTVGYSVRFVLLVFGLPISLKFGGLVGGIVALAMIEMCRYIAIFVGQKRERFSFGGQDLGITIAMFLMIGLWEGLRWVSGLGTSFDSLPIGELVGLRP
jgi:O-antigen/teichoic acid export membrane protein